MESLSEGTTAGYQQIHDGIIHLVDSARTETVRSAERSPHNFPKA